MRWLAVHLPWLPLDALDLEATDETACAVAERGADGLRLLLPNDRARKAGVKAGLSGAAARALVPDLRLLARDTQREQRLLTQLALWALQFSSQVSLAPPDALILEVGGSRRLFGGLRPLVKTLHSGLTGMSLRSKIVFAPTPHAALLLARASDRRWVADAAGLREALASVALDALPVTPRKRAALHRSGLRSCADLLPLPRAALAGRLGADFLDWWGRLLGEVPDPWPLFEPPALFDEAVEPVAAVETVEGLVFPLRRLLMVLEGFLRGRQLAVQRLDCRLEHEEAETTTFALGFQAPLRDAPRMTVLVRERLAHLRLPAPVRRIGLRADAFSPWAGEPGWLPGEQVAMGDQTLIDRLRARLGRDAVSGLCLRADHRPEFSMRRCRPGEQGEEAGFPQRPLWLLPAPQPMETRGRRPYWRGPLRVIGECERIDTGWWDGLRVRRDYFVAEATDGARLWIFRQDGGEPGIWYLHGFFG